MTRKIFGTINDLNFVRPASQDIESTWPEMNVRTLKREVAATSI